MISAVLPPDLVFAARLLRKSPAFTLVAVVSLALANGANKTIFSIAKQLLFERLDVPNAANLRLLTSTDANFSYPMYEQLRAHNQVLGDMLAFHATAVNATVGENAERVLAHEVSGNYYAVLGVRPQLGRAILPVDDTGGSEPVVVISDEFWEREFARSPAVSRTVDQTQRCCGHDHRGKSRRLYWGAMGEVYRADDLKVGQRVALKFLPMQFTADASRVNRFVNEVRLARQISHPNVCRVYDIGEADGRHYLSMEFIEPGTALVRINRASVYTSRPHHGMADWSSSTRRGIPFQRHTNQFGREVPPSNLHLWR